MDFLKTDKMSMKNRICEIFLSFLYFNLKIRLLYSTQARIEMMKIQTVKGRY